MNMEIWRAKHKQLFQMTEQKQLIFQIWLLTAHIELTNETIWNSERSQVDSPLR